MEKPSKLVKWSFLFENTESAMLMRIEFLVVAIAITFLLMSFLDMYRRRSRYSSIKYIILILDAISDSSFIYTIGLMQSAPFKKDLFSVWALILVNLRFNACFISAYGIPDQENRRIDELGKAMALLGVAFLVGTQNSQFKHPIWALWVMQQLRSIYLITAYNFAVRSFLHGMSSPLLVAYMGTPDVICQDGNPTTMQNYKYLVSGDQCQKVQLKAPGYKFELEERRQTQKLLITLDKTWNLAGDNRNSDNVGSRTEGGSSSTDVRTEWMKDLCLSFALYRLLRCRFDDLSLPAGSITNTRKLIYKIIGKNDSGDLAGQVDQHVERTFRIAKLELAFLNDYFYTRYPILFWRGFPLFCAWHPLLTIALIIWLACDIYRLYKPKDREISHIVRGANVDLIITWIFMGIIVLKELWKMATYLLSDWTKVMLLCAYTSQSVKCIPQRLWEFLVRILCTPRCAFVHRWHNKIGQYEFLQSYDHNPWNILHYSTLGLVPKEIKGGKEGKATELPPEVKTAVLKSLCSLDLEQNSLESELPIDRKQFEWTFKLRSWCHSILVWHIATSLCEIELAQHYNTSITLSEVLCAIKTALNCFSSQPYVIKAGRLEEALRANYVAANSISRYCAYLLVKEPDLLPDSYLTADDIFRSTIAEASEFLNGCDNLQSIYRTLIREGEPQQHADQDAGEAAQVREGEPQPDTAQDAGEAAQLREGGRQQHTVQDAGEAAQLRQGRPQPDTVQDASEAPQLGEGERQQHNVQDAGEAAQLREGEPQPDTNQDAGNRKKRSEILEKAGQLAWYLIHKFNDEVRWKVLAEVWADILVHTAPSWNAAAHKKCLANGGEFITHIWLILSHCNVQSSKRWPCQESPVDAQEAAEVQAVGEENQTPPQQEPTSRAAATDDVILPSNGTPPSEPLCSGKTSNTIPEQHLTANDQRYSQVEEEIQEIRQD